MAQGHGPAAGTGGARSRPPPPNGRGTRSELALAERPGAASRRPRSPNAPSPTVRHLFVGGCLGVRVSLARVGPPLPTGRAGHGGVAAAPT
eukprot:10523606-Alexandrium_andersonii.AAC.1